MTEPHPTFWRIHGGRDGDVDSRFLEEGYVKLGWNRLGDLRLLPDNLEAFRVAVAKNYPDKELRTISSWAGMIYRFVHEMRPGHFVVYRPKRDKSIHIGRIAGNYEHLPVRFFQDVRKTDWLTTVQAEEVSQGALKQISIPPTLIQISHQFVPEWLTFIRGR
jgi:restriction system protein